MAPPIPPGWSRAFQALACSPSGRNRVYHICGVTKKCAPVAPENTPHSHTQDGSDLAGSRGAPPCSVTTGFQPADWIPGSDSREESQDSKNHPGHFKHSPWRRTMAGCFLPNLLAQPKRPSSCHFTHTVNPKQNKNVDNGSGICCLRENELDLHSWCTCSYKQAGKLKPPALLKAGATATPATKCLCAVCTPVKSPKIIIVGLKNISIHQVHFRDVFWSKIRLWGRFWHFQGLGVPRTLGGARSLYPWGPQGRAAPVQGRRRPRSPEVTASGPQELCILCSRLATAPRAQPIAPRRRGYPRALTGSNLGTGCGGGITAHAQRAPAPPAPPRMEGGPAVLFSHPSDLRAPKEQPSPPAASTGPAAGVPAARREGPGLRSQLAPHREGWGLLHV